MPWTPEDADKHKKGLTARQRRVWAAVANSALKSCLARNGKQSECEGSAIQQANAVSGRIKPIAHEATAQLCTLAVHTTGFDVRYEVLQDRPYLVAPIVAIVAGVLNEHLVPEDELVACVASWNSVPVPVGHPTNDYGDYVSARTPEQLEQSVGFFFNAHMDPPRLLGEIWLDIARCEQRGDEALECLRRLEAGESIECSTAYYAGEVAMQQGVFRGARYTSTHRYLRPDHLALLPNSIGACSIQDGCGVRAHTISSSPCPCGCEGACTMALASHIRSSARRPTFSGTETTAWSAPSLADCITAMGDSGMDSGMAVADMPMALKRKVAGISLLGDPAADTFRDLTMFPVVSPRTGKLNEGALRAVISGRGSQANIPEAAKTSAQTMARRLLNSEFDAGLETNMEQDTPGRLRTAITALVALATGVSHADAPALATHLTHDDIAQALCSLLCEQLEADMAMMYGPAMLVDVQDDYVIYKHKGELYRQAYTVDAEGVVALSGEPEDVQRNTQYLPLASNAAHQPGHVGAQETPATEGDPVMKPKAELVQALIAHQHTTWTAEDAVTLDAFTEAQLTDLLAEASKRAPVVASAAAPEGVSPAPEPAGVPVTVTLEAITALLRTELDARDAMLETRLAAHTQRMNTEAERTQLVAHLQAAGWTEQECTGMTLEALRKVAPTVAPVTFAGMGMPAFPRPSLDVSNLPDDDPKWD